MNIQRIVLFLLICVFLTIGSSESFAVGKVGGDETRTCSAHYEVYPPAGPPYTSPEFTATGTCFKANDCRRTAHNRLHNCISKHWSPGHSVTKPWECTEPSVYNYPFVNLHQQLMSKYCEHFRTAREIITTVKSKIHGDNGCGGGIRKEELYTHATQYRIDCSQYVTPATPPSTTQETLHAINPNLAKFQNMEVVTSEIVPTIVLPTPGQVFSKKEPIRICAKLPQEIERQAILLQFEYRDNRTWVYKTRVAGIGCITDFTYKFFNKTGEWRVKAKNSAFPNAPWSDFVTFRIR